MKQKGITLIAMVITIIILLILAGVAISSITGENGLLANVKLVKQKYSIAETKEKLELKITELRLEIEGKGETLTKEHLPKINSDEIDVGNIESFPISIIYGKYKFNIDEKFVITYVGEADGTIITYTTEPVGYTNEDEIEILIKISNPKGIKTIEFPDGDKLEANGATERGIDYKVTANGTYIFKVLDVDDKEITKEVYIDQIDKLAPIDFTPDVAKDGTTITITPNAQDAETDGISTKSGIDYCEYYLIDKNNKEVKYETNVIENLSLGTYQVYVITYDRAGNSKQSGTIEVKISLQFNKISTGQYHTFAIDKEGRLWGFGSHRVTKIGTSYLNTLIPIQIHEEKRFKDIKTYSDTTLAIDDEDNLYSWGRNSFGSLGDGNSESSIFGLTRVNIDTKAKEIAVTDSLSRVIDENGDLWSFGGCYVGNGTQSKSSVPEKIKEDIKFLKAEAGGTYNNGWNFSVALDEDGKLWSWGYNWNGATLGTNEIASSKAALSPIQIDTGDTIFKEISAAVDSYHSLALDEEGNIWSWGYNMYGQLGNGTTENINIPTKIDTGNVKFKKISAGNAYSLAIDEEGNIWSWGYNNYGQLGNGTTKNINIPTKIDTGNIKFKEIDAGYNHSLALDEEGNIWAWGYNMHGQFGNGTNKNSYIPIQVN